MNKAELYHIFVKIFEYIYSKSVNYIVLTPNKLQQKQIYGFIDFLDKKIGIDAIGEEWVFNFLAYIFEWRIFKKTKYKGIIPINWILGQKAYEYYEKRGENWLFFNDKFNSKYSIQFDKIRAKTTLKTDNNYEDNLRRQYVEDSYPLHLCLDTVSYDLNSIYCQRCSSSKQCVIINK